MPNHSKVLLTGVNGFLGLHTTIQLLNHGYRVLGTLRNLNRAHEIEKLISKHVSNEVQLRIAEAHLTDENVWHDLMKGIDYVLHIASPFPSVLPKHEDELVKPAKNGTLNVLNAATENGIQRVVMTSSSGAIIYGKEKSKRSGTYTENDWTDLTYKKDTTPYYRSKTIAEKAAWDFIHRDNRGLELSTICPGAMLGPVLSKDLSASINIVKKTMDGSSPSVPKIGYDIVDVRSVADLHIQVMEMKEAAGERFIGSAGYLTFKQVADILHEKYPDRKIPKSKLPNFAVKIISNFEKTLKPLLLDLDVERKLDNSKAKKVMNWEPISSKEAVLSCAASLIDLDLL